jgi:hypothetical protein
MFAIQAIIVRASDKEILVGVIAIVVFTLYALVQLLKRLTSGPIAPDPWDAETTAKLEDANTSVLCHHCLVPNEPLADFCENCGAPVGKYTNYLPFPQVFSIGHALRVGTAGEYKRSPIAVLGYFLLALGEYTVFAPVYWFWLLRRMPSKAQNTRSAS